MGRYLVRVRAAGMTWPEACACCGDPPTVTRPPVRALFRKASTEPVPYCDACARHIDEWTAGGTRANQIGFGAWSVGVLVYVATHTPAGAAVFGVGVVVAAVAVVRARRAARAACGPRCTAVAPAVAAIAGGFRLASESYAAAIVGANRDCLPSASPQPRVVRDADET